MTPSTARRVAFARAILFNRAASSGRTGRESIDEELA